MGSEFRDLLEGKGRVRHEMGSLIEVTYVYSSHAVTKAVYIKCIVCRHIMLAYVIYSNT